MAKKKQSIESNFESPLSKEEMVVKFHEKAVGQILEQIRSVEGFKRITLVVRNGAHTHSQKFSMDSLGVFAPKEESVFRLVLSIGLDNGGGVVLRQFLDEKIPFTSEPQKKVYGLMLREGGYSPLRPEKMKEMHETDSETGHPLPPEEGVSYGDWEALLPQEMLDSLRPSSKQYH